MKYIIPSLLLCSLTLRLSAQPVINNVEGYSMGDFFTLADCPAVAAGPSGPGQVWNFSGLASANTVTLSILPVPSSSIYRSANVLEQYSDGVDYYMKTTPIEDYIVGMTSVPAAGGLDSVTYIDNVLAIIRPFTYTSTASGIFTLHTTFYPGVTGPVAGTGTITLTGDGYGTLLLPNGTYNNVLRVMISEQSGYRLGSGGSINQTIHTYKWYNNTSVNPLLRIDSLVVTYLPLGGVSSVSTQIKVRYLVSSTNLLGVPFNANNPTTDLKANINQDELSLFGNFAEGKTYSATLYNTIGAKVFSEPFTASGNREIFNLTSTLSPGLYILNLINNESSSAENIKVIKH